LSGLSGKIVVIGSCLPMATIFPKGFLRKYDKNYFFGNLASGRVLKVATSVGHHFARKFLEKN
jgi:hypothetical protein